MRTLFPPARRAALVVLAFAACGAWAQADEKLACAMLLMHGRGDSPATVAALARKLKPACIPRTAEMPWSQRRAWDKDYSGAIREITVHIKDLRRQGFRRVLVAGHDIGANAAMAYAAEVGDVDGVIAIAPTQLDKREAAAPKAAMLSYHDAKGLGDIPSMTPRIRQHIPLLWVIGARDPLQPLGEGYAYAKAPPHPQGRYVVVQADHAGAPDAAARPVLEWLKALE